MVIANCKRCGNKRRINAKGMCLSCYNMTTHDKDKAKDRQKKWLEGNKEHSNTYFREYQRKKRGIKPENFRKP